MRWQRTCRAHSIVLRWTESIRRNGKNTFRESPIRMSRFAGWFSRSCPLRPATSIGYGSTPVPLTPIRESTAPIATRRKTSHSSGRFTRRRKKSKARCNNSSAATSLARSDHATLSPAIRSAIRGSTIELPSIQFAQAVISMAIEPENTAERKKLADVLEMLKRQDPTFHAQENTETGQTLISGMGELHLDVIKNRLLRDFNSTSSFTSRESAIAKRSKSAAIVKASAIAWSEHSRCSPAWSFRLNRSLTTLPTWWSSIVAPRKTAPRESSPSRLGRAEESCAGWWSHRCYSLTGFRVGLLSSELNETGAIGEAPFKMAANEALKRDSSKASHACSNQS